MATNFHFVVLFFKMRTNDYFDISQDLLARPMMKIEKNVPHFLVLPDFLKSG